MLTRENGLRVKTFDGTREIVRQDRVTGNRRVRRGVYVFDRKKSRGLCGVLTPLPRIRPARLTRAAVAVDASIIKKNRLSRKENNNHNNNNNNKTHRKPVGLGSSVVHVDGAYHSQWRICRRGLRSPQLSAFAVVRPHVNYSEPWLVVVRCVRPAVLGAA